MMASETKEQWRREIWGALERAEVDRFPGARGRIPNFKVAEAAAGLLAATPEWAAATAIKANPDSPQRPVRERALREGKRLYMAVPRLREAAPFLELDPARLDPGELRRASTMEGSMALARPVTLEEMAPIDLVVAGSVAVDVNGRRVGKGGGYADLEYALVRERGLLGADTPVVTTVHPLQVVAGPLPREDHDLVLSIIVTRERVIRCTDRPVPPSGIDWSRLEPAKIEAIPVLRSRRQGKEL